MLNLYPEEIAKVMNGQTLMAHSVIEEIGTKVICDQDFMDAQHAWSIYSRYPSKKYVSALRPNYSWRTRKLTYEKCWEDVLKTFGYNFATYGNAYLFMSGQVVLETVSYHSNHDYYICSDFYVADLGKSIVQFKQISSYVRYYLARQSWRVLRIPRPATHEYIHSNCAYRAKLDSAGIVSMRPALRVAEGWRDEDYISNRLLPKPKPTEDCV
jgi:hypothetical protein